MTAMTDKRIINFTDSTLKVASPSQNESAIIIK